MQKSHVNARITMDLFPDQTRSVEFRLDESFVPQEDCFLVLRSVKCLRSFEQQLFYQNCISVKPGRFLQMINFDW
jgi:hypothetical protein